MSRLITIIIFLFLAPILGIGFVWPKYQELIDLKKLIEIKKTEIKEKNIYFENLRNIEKELKNYQDQLAKIDSALPAESDPEILLNFLQKTSSQYGLVLIEIGRSITQPVTREGIEKGKESDIKKTELSFKVGGTYPSFKSFLSALEMSARLIEVESISFSGAEKEEDWDFNLKINVYSY